MTNAADGCNGLRCLKQDVEQNLFHQLSFKLITAQNWNTADESYFHLTPANRRKSGVINDVDLTFFILRMNF